jgi:transaldolase
MVGGSIHVTINWSTALELIQANPAVVSRMDFPVSPLVIDELSDKLPDFRKAYLDHGLLAEEFGDFGPLQYFRDMFVKGWDTLVKCVTDRRHASSPTLPVQH